MASVLSSAQRSCYGSTIEERTRQILGWSDSFRPQFTPSWSQLALSSPSSPPIGATAEQRSRKKASTGVPCGYHYGALITTDSNQSSPGSSSSCGSPSPDTSMSHQKLPVYRRNTAAGQISFSPPPPPMPLHPVSKRRKTLPDLGATPKSSSTSRTGSGSGSGSRGPSSATAQRAFERLRNLLPSLTTEQSKYRALVETVAHVVEMEAKLALLKEESDGVSVAATATNFGPAEFATDSRTAKRRHSSPGGAEAFTPVRAVPGMPELTRASVGRPQGVSSVPDDLLNLDLSAFKSLVQSPGGKTPSSTTSRIHHEQQLPSYGEAVSSSSFYENYTTDDLKVETSFEMLGWTVPSL